MTIQHKSNEFLRCLKEERFYDAHEVLEELWFPRRFENTQEVQLLKGFINAAVSFELLKRGRKEQSKKVWKNYLKYRQLLYKVQGQHANSYHQLARAIETLQRKLHHH